ncbi:MAG: amino acid--tRNA ligase-related protein [Candidatus Micrarchaeaceae archaeon]|jgi:aspartyl/asparaginyl-tRNA synthetase
MAQIIYSSVALDNYWSQHDADIYAAGGLRRRDTDRYLEIIKGYGWSTKEFKPYIDIIQEYPEQNTGGFGIGMERLIGAIIGNNKIGELQPYPRNPGRKIDF